MAAHAEGADHHDGAHRIARRLQHVGVGQGGAVGDSLILDLLFEGLFDKPPIAVERRHQFAIGLDRPMAGAPGRALGVLADIAGIIGQAVEEFAPFRIDRLGIVFVAGLQLLDIGGVAAIEEGCDREAVVGLVLP